MTKSVEAEHRRKEQSGRIGVVLKGYCNRGYSGIIVLGLGDDRAKSYDILEGSSLDIVLN